MLTEAAAPRNQDETTDNTEHSTITQTAHARRSVIKRGVDSQTKVLRSLHCTDHPREVFFCDENRS
jgi:hypothetical protein